MQSCDNIYTVYPSTCLQCLRQAQIPARSPPPQRLAKDDKENREHCDRETQSAYTDEGVLLAHAGNPGLNAPRDPKADEVPDQDDSCNDLCVKQRVAVQDV